MLSVWQGATTRTNMYSKWYAKVFDCDGAK